MDRRFRMRAWNKRSHVMRHAFFIEANGWELRENDTAGYPRMNENDYIVMQSTGVKDRNGVEIYEGDILRRRDTNGGALGRLFSVKWDIRPTGVGFNIRSFGGDLKTIEVVGNIYENPELLTRA